MKLEQSQLERETLSKSWEESSKEEKERYKLSTERDGVSTLKKSLRKRPMVIIHSNLLIFPRLIGQQAQIPIHPSNCMITTLKLDKNRKALLDRKKRIPKQKLKHKQGAGMAGVDWSTPHLSLIEDCNLLYSYSMYSLFKLLNIFSLSQILYINSMIIYYLLYASHLLWI